MIARLAILAALASCASSPHAEPKLAASCTAAPSGTEANKALVARFTDELWAKKNPDAAVSGILAADLVNHSAIPEAQGAEGMRTLARKLLVAFPDVTMTTVDTIAEGDRVVIRTIFEGTQTGELAFKQPIPATGKHVKVEQVHTFRIADGKIVEVWMTMDHLELMKQLGLLHAGT